MAPLWDPDQRTFVGLMTIYDYIRALRICQARGISATDLAAQTLSDILHTAPFLLRHTGFPHIDAEDSVFQLCQAFYSGGNDYICVVDPETNALVSIVGPLDVLHLLHLVAKANISMFSQTVQSLGLGTWDSEVFTAPLRAPLGDLLDALENRGDLSAAPILDDNNRLVGIYHRSDVSFAMKAADVEAALSNLRTCTAQEALTLREQLLQSGEIMSAYQGLVTCKASDTVLSVLHALVHGRAHRAVIVDEHQQCRGVLSFKDLLRHFLDLPSIR